MSDLLCFIVNKYLSLTRRRHFDVDPSSLMSKSAYIVAVRRYDIKQKLLDSVAMIQRLVAFVTL